MPISLGVIMDPIGSIKYHKDSTLAMLLAASRRGWELHYMEMDDLSMQGGEALAEMRPLKVHADEQNWYELGATETRPLHTLDAILMRKDPPFDMEYIYATYMLEQAERQGTLVVNRARSLRDANEKVFTSCFPQCTPPTLISRRATQLREFVQRQGETILKPLEGMGGASIFKTAPGDPNTSVIIETLTGHGSRYAMAQRFIPEIAAGDKRILLVDGAPVPYALARIPASGELRGNLAAGGQGIGVNLSERDYWICEQVAPTLREMGLLFVGLDVIGDYLTEVNVTSPTCIRELDREYGLDIGGQLMDAIAQRLEGTSQ
ncbi:MAG: glutathione synthase [Gammaproteobacteria bacterium]|nr:glutathione synthase [Gammaproteobacteria bacterium]MCW8839605.1 glutathione synthase [Gammaproteobacteria bacterium]MCW8928217.1 glutathione synthase [Gammaproteobacteria bacterium]MCW8957459.1 glutathione synthase [Gammaproteobacteria bacterium]MCW8973304.1 glutathione synthase [Gammaproteobacteria bacterium]